MTISPSSDKGHNMKPREVKCLRCRKTWVTDDLRPECSECQIPAITVVKSLIPEENDELAQGIS
jgi:Zn finger protein HypA/HybF involved in hydrogenase expression